MIKKRIDTINSNRIYIIYMIMAVLIVQIHSYGMVMFDESVQAISYIQGVDLLKRVISSAAVPVFFFMSGYFFFRNEQQEKYIGIIKRKVITILIPLILWALVGTTYALFTSILKKELGLGDLSLLDITVRVLLLKDNPILWFMRAIFIYQCIYPILEWLIQHKKIAIISIVIVGILNMLLGPTNYYGTCHYWFPEYFGGAVVGRYFDEWFLNWKTIFKKYVNIIYMGAICFLGILIAFAMMDINGMGIYVFRLFIIVPIWVLFGAIKYSGKLHWTMRSSMYVCSSHILLCGFTSKIYFRILGYGTVQSVLGYLIVPVGIVVVLLGIAMIWKKIFPRLWNVFNGSR